MPYTQGPTHVKFCSRLSRKRPHFTDISQEIVFFICNKNVSIHLLFTDYLHSLNVSSQKYEKQYFTDNWQHWNESQYRLLLSYYYQPSQNSLQLQHYLTKSSLYLEICSITLKYRENLQTNKTSSSAITERPCCRVGQFWPKVQDDILQTI